ncbi:hypothetical protein M2132_000078 [Dysgonomonas sp. PH5-45]|uniref:DUF4251 domain-containing protein n=1 Tax=unclassified Dysgonomonas TaxID=2630389 RepID=UPI002475129A|nr:MULTISPECIES: DUF4251 domain-containing protein [unclassified Dysgonomonas]MDH6353761.1 hypothetical protein [Dysgonomonas sp. PH5-45]MDH6386664.1 hypothetical protein [Dysgonomonas sp. PH5-37]
MKKLLSICLVFTAICLGNISAENFNVTTSDTENELDSVTYLLKVTTAFPMGERAVDVAKSGYTFKISKQQLYADLPYLGKSNKAPIGASSTGINVKTKKFSFQSEDVRKNKRVITVKTRSGHQTTFTLEFDPQKIGFGNLKVVDAARLPITFHGTLEVEKTFGK